MPFRFSFGVLHLRDRSGRGNSESGRAARLRLRKTIPRGNFGPSSPLAVGAVVGTPPGEHGAANGRSADLAGLAATHIDAVLELEKAGHPVGVHVIGNRGAAQFDGLPQDCLQSGMEPGEVLAGEAARHAGGTDSGAKEALVGINVAHPMEQLLVQQGSLDGQLAIAEEGTKFVGRDGQGLVARPAKGSRIRSGMEGETPKTAGIDKA